MKLYLAFDVGTTAMKCILFDRNFNEVAYASEEYDLIMDHDGRAEFDAEKYYIAFCECTGKIINAGFKAEDIKAVTITTQGETLICVDKSGKALSNAIVWLDTRAQREADGILNEIGDQEFYSKTGLWQPDGALPLAKLLYIRRNEPDLFKKTHKFLLLEDYLIYRLTGKFATEKSLVSSTGWYDIVGDNYYDAALDFCEIPSDKLPEVFPCGTVIGNIKNRECKLAEETVVVCGAMDQICSAIGAGNINEGILTETTGTALVLGATVEKPVFDSKNPITIYRHFDNKYIYMPYCSTAGIVLKWFKDTVAAEICDKANLAGISAYQMIDKYVEASECGSNGVILLPHFSGRAIPEIMPNASGAFLGITLKTTIADLTRSVLEGIACMLYEMVELLEKRGVFSDKILSMGGGANSRIWGEIKAAVTQKAIEVNQYSETTSLGAAILGAVACGEYCSVQEAVLKVRPNQEIIFPDNSWIEKYKPYYEKYKEVYKLLKPIFE